MFPRPFFIFIYHAFLAIRFYTSTGVSGRVRSITLFWQHDSPPKLTYTTSTNQLDWEHGLRIPSPLDVTPGPSDGTLDPCSVAPGLITYSYWYLLKFYTYTHYTHYFAQVGEM